MMENDRDIRREHVTRWIVSHLLISFRCHNIELCVLVHISDLFFPISSITHLLVVCLNKFYAITNTYSYHSNATYGRRKLVVAGIWFYAFLWTSLGVFCWDAYPSFYYEIRESRKHRLCTGENPIYHITLTVVIYIIPMMITTVLYSIIISIAAKRASETPQHVRYNMKTHWMSFKAPKGLKTLVAVFSAYVICWLPHFIVILIQYTNVSQMIRFFESSPIVYDIVTTVISNFLPTMNSAINPFIYFMMSQKFKHAFRDCCRKMLKRSRYMEDMSNEKDVFRKCRRNLLIKIWR